MSKKRNIAFVHYPHAADNARLDTMPFAANSVRQLAETGCHVDVYLWEKPLFDYSALFPQNVHIHYQDDKWIPVIDSVLIRLSKKAYKENTYRYRFRSGKKYDCVFGLGQIGAYIAHQISQRNKAPLVLLNDEFPSAFPDTNWRTLEREAARDAAMIVVPDEQRIKLLQAEYDLSGHPYAVLPNVARFHLPDRKINWHERLGIPAHLSLFLHAGSVDDYAQVPELMMSVKRWPENTALVLNDRNTGSVEKMKRYYRHLQVEGRIFWNTEPLNESMLNSLVAYCKANFGLYRSKDDNIEYIGLSSGKIMRSIAAGVPVIATDFQSLKFIAQNNLGVLVNHPDEISSAVDSILEGKQDYRANCLDFYERHCNFDKYWEVFSEKLFSLTKITLKRS